MSCNLLCACVQFWQRLWTCTRHLLGSPGSHRIWISCAFLLVNIYTITLLMQKIYWFVSVEVFLNWHNDISQWVQSQRMLWLMYRLTVWICPPPLKGTNVYVWHQLSQHIAQDLSSRTSSWKRNWKARPIWWCQLSRLYWARATTSYPSFSLEQLKCEISDFTLSSKTFFGIQLAFDEQTVFSGGSLIREVPFLLF